MRKSNLVVCLAAASALVIGSIGMAAAQGPHVGAHSHGLVGEDASLASRHATALPVLRGKVNDAKDITLSDTSPAPGRYKIVIRDSTAAHNWHIFGQGQSRATSVTGTGKTVFRMRLSSGSYTVQCDVHPTTMSFKVQVS